MKVQKIIVNDFISVYSLQWQRVCSYKIVHDELYCTCQLVNVRAMILWGTRLWSGRKIRHEFFYVMNKFYQTWRWADDMMDLQICVDTIQTWRFSKTSPVTVNVYPAHSLTGTIKCVTSHLSTISFCVSCDNFVQLTSLTKCGFVEIGVFLVKLR